MDGINWLLVAGEKLVAFFRCRYSVYVKVCYFWVSKKYLVTQTFLLFRYTVDDRL